MAPTVLGECSSWLSMKGYSPGSAAGVVNVLGRLSMWMRVVGAEVEDIDEELLARFVAQERSRDVVCVTAMRALGTMRRFLVAGGYLDSAVVESGQPTPAQAAVAQWRWHQRRPIPCLTRPSPNPTRVSKSYLSQLLANPIL